MARFLNTCFWNFSLSTKKWARGIPQYIFFFLFMELSEVNQCPYIYLSWILTLFILTITFCTILYMSILSLQPAYTFCEGKSYKLWLWVLCFFPISASIENKWLVDNTMPCNTPCTRTMVVTVIICLILECSECIIKLQEIVFF